MMDFNLVIGGEAGQGLNTLEAILSKAFFRQGFHLFSSQDYMSRIRGGHNFMELRLSHSPLAGPTQGIDLLLALNQEALDMHREKVKERGVILFNGEKEEEGILSLDGQKLATSLGNPKVVNTIFIGAIFKLMGLSAEIIEEILASTFKEKILELNLKALEIGSKEVETFFSLEKRKGFQNRILLNGSEAIGLGAALAGVSFYSAYPMTPSTGIMNYLAGKQEEMGLVIEQAEDEIAAIHMALGASYGGIRAMTGTSGGGFSLMNEALGLAGITEIPLVIANVQRPGPATGLPTRTEQGDLLFVIHSSQGEFPLYVTAPRDAEDAFYQAFRSFAITEKYQLPVILLSDQFLADSSKDVEAFPIEELKNQRFLVTKDQLEGEYKRYEITPDGISKRAYPGQFPGEVVLVDSDEHDERGHIIESANLRKAMVDKRARKIERLKEEDLKEPLFLGDEEMDLLILCWGSTYGPLKEALRLLWEENYKVGLLSFNDLWPLPLKELVKRKSSAKTIITVENNSTAQLSQLIKSQMTIEIEGHILKYDGRPFYGDELKARITREVLS